MNVMECSFGRLRAHCRSLTMRLAVAKEDITIVITTCAGLHNIYEDKGQLLPEDPSVGRPLMPHPPDGHLVIDRHQKIVETLIQDMITNFLGAHL